jgi:hypothetical protein
VAAGAIQDRTPGQAYDKVIHVLNVLIAIKSIETCLGPVYDFLDGRWLGHSLRAPEKRRLEIYRNAVINHLDYKGWRINKITMGIVATQLTCMIITGWAVSRGDGTAVMVRH